MQLLLSIALAALSAHQAHAHGYVSQPEATFPNGIDTSFLKTISESADPDAFGGLKWNGSPQQNVDTFSDAFANSKYKTLRELIDANVDGCGATDGKATPVDVSGMSTMTWQNDQEKVGFVKSHTGPCEVWIDDQRVAYDENCVATYPDYPAAIPVDYSVCSGTCELTFYWLALHEPNWQVYKNCVQIENGSGGNTGSEAGGAPPAADNSAASGGENNFEAPPASNNQGQNQGNQGQNSGYEDGNSQGNQGQNQGNQGQNQGNQGQNQGNQGQNQGNQDQNQGKQGQNQGSQGQNQGNQGQNQGNNGGDYGTQPTDGEDQDETPSAVNDSQPEAPATGCAAKTRRFRA